MKVRWLHKVWSVFWTIIGIVLLVVIIVGGIGFGVLQLPASKSFIVKKIEQRFNDQHKGVLKLGEFSGTLPTELVFSSIDLYPDSVAYESIFSTDTVSATLDFWALFRNRFVINGLSASSPTIVLDGKSNQSIITAIQKRKTPELVLDTTLAATPFVEIFAPSVSIKNGTVIARNFSDEETATFDSITFEDINLRMFLDYNEEARFLDIDEFSMKIPELGVENLSLYGQIFNDERFLEFNAFNVRFANSLLRFSGEADGVNLFEQDILNQIRESDLSLAVEELIADPVTINRFYGEYPITNESFYLSLNSKGDLDSLWIDEFQLGLGGSSLDGYGFVVNPLNIDQIKYGGELRNILIDSSEVQLLTNSLSNQQQEALLSSSYAVEVDGDINSLHTLIELINKRGNVDIDAELDLVDNLALRADVTLSNVDIGNLLFPQVVSSNLTGQIILESSSVTDLKQALGKANIQLYTGSINGISYNSFIANGDWKDGIINPSFNLVSPSTSFRGRGLVNLQDSIPEIEFSGSGQNLNLKALTQSQRMDSAVVDLEYEVFLKGSDINNVQGQLSIIIPEAIVGGDSIPSHQLYADFNDPASEERLLRITSTALDFSVEGDFKPKDIIALTPYWGTFFNERINQEIKFKETRVDSLHSLNVVDQDFQLSLALKELGLLKKYFPNISSANSKAEIVTNVTIDEERMLFNGSINDPKFSVKNIEVDSLSTQFTGSFRFRDELKAFSRIQVQAQSKSLKTDFITGNDLSFSFDMDDDSVTFSQSIAELAEATGLEVEGMIALTDTSIRARINDFSLGSDAYKWENKDFPTVSYLPDNKIEFQDFSFVNFDEFISIAGTFSNEPADSVNYVIRSVNLERISDLVNGRINFAGNLDGTFTTRSLTRIPTIQGELNVIEFGIDNNVVGDLTINSVFNQSSNRFDTDISISTDSTKYPEYFIRNDRKGQDILLTGYVLAPEEGIFPEVDSLFKFDLDFENVDLWVIPFIAPKVFSEMSGKASGEGLVWGNLETYDFKVDYQVGMEDAVYMKPKFLDTYYYGQGLVTFSRSNGLEFNDLFIIDPSGGSAILSGSYNLNDFQQIHSIDLELDMDEFQFLNSSFDPIIPFFGKAYGSSIVKLTGTNLSPVLSTTSPVYISDFSTIGIPLLEETEFDEDNKFIRFVDNFSFAKGEQNIEGEGGQNFDLGIEENLFERTFTERFTVDLQFIATQPMTVQLIFDPITGDIITADGTGRIRIRLQDEELSMFGQFDISGGNYQFVSGDIFTRRFDLDRGGTIIWDGAPTDARLNLNAIYEARPDINTLTRARSDIDQESSQRVPVQLVLRVGGSLSSIENNFFFRLPNTFETRQNTTLSTQINTLNRNEDEKLIQATSFLLMGDFIPSTSASTDGTNSLTDNFSGSGAVLNPLLSSQVISPLLSNQINSLLRSDVGSLDIDFNLNTYNNVDLAVALRLYNDRIILSREGQITGSQSNIGDLGATYRINQTLSVTAFHRQDPTFSSFGSVEESQQAQDINGLGLEAEVSFNTWDEFLRKITKPFRKLFGVKDKEENNELTQNENPPS